MVRAGADSGPQRGDICEPSRDLSGRRGARAFSGGAARGLCGFCDGPLRFTLQTSILPYPVAEAPPRHYHED